MGDQMTALPFLTLDDLKRRGMRRVCGGCAACCHVIQVEEIGKGFRSRCPHLVERQGCAIWGGPGGPGGQPQVCATYRCAWAMGFGEPRDRPDKSGVLVDLRIPTLVSMEQPALYAIGVREGTEATPKARQAMKNIAQDAGRPVHLADRMMKVLEVVGV